MTQLLSSVRNLAEAKQALAAGSDWLDLKEPDAGALGAVPTHEIRRIINWARDTGIDVPLSATIGDCWWQAEAIPERVAAMNTLGVDFIKIGLFIDELNSGALSAIQSVAEHKLIIVCFAEKPLDGAVIDDLVDAGVCGLMLDTAEKFNGSLTEKLTFDEIRRFVAAAKSHGVLCGLAGSLRATDIADLICLNPDYLGFRGALCDLSRTGQLCGERVANIKSTLQMQSDRSTLCATY